MRFSALSRSAQVYALISSLFPPSESIYGVFDLLFQQSDGEWRRKTLEFETTFAQFASAYLHLKIVVASVLIVLALNRLYRLLDTLVAWWEARRAKMHFDLRAHLRAQGTSPRRLVFASILLSAVVLPLLMFDYAE